MAKNRVKKSASPTRHHLEWFLNRVESNIYRLVRLVPEAPPQRQYIKIMSPAHARALFTYQNDNNIFYYES